MFFRDIKSLLERIHEELELINTQLAAIQANQ